MTDKLTNAPTCSDTPEGCQVTRSDIRVKLRFIPAPREGTSQPPSGGVGSKRHTRSQGTKTLLPPPGGDHGQK